MSHEYFHQHLIHQANCNPLRPYWWSGKIRPWHSVCSLAHQVVLSTREPPSTTFISSQMNRISRSWTKPPIHYAEIQLPPSNEASSRCVRVNAQPVQAPAPFESCSFSWTKIPVIPYFSFFSWEKTVLYQKSIKMEVDSRRRQGVGPHRPWVFFLSHSASTHSLCLCHDHCLLCLRL